MSDPVAEIVSTIQSASIKRDPSPAHDLNPSTAASANVPIDSPSLKEQLHDQQQTSSSRPPTASSTANTSSSSTSAPSIPSSALHPPEGQSASRRNQRPQHPALPDLRFEQSYLASIKDAETNGAVAWITMRDQVFMPLIQGTLWTLFLSGWRHWNQGAKLHGESAGARLRRWWYGVNNWAIDGQAGGKSLKKDKKLARDVGEVRPSQTHSKRTWDLYKNFRKC